MNKLKILKIALIVLLTGIVIAGGVVYYLFNMPHRDIQSSATDHQLTVTQLVNEYVDNPTNANKKYLSEDGQSAILEIRGTVSSITENMNGETVLMLSGDDAPARVKCTLIPLVDDAGYAVSKDDNITVKGVIRAGTYFDEDFNRYEPVVMDHCAIIR